VNQYAKYLGQWSFSSKQRQTDTHQMDCSSWIWSVKNDEQQKPVLGALVVVTNEIL